MIDIKIKSVGKKVFTEFSDTEVIQIEVAMVLLELEHIKKELLKRIFEPEAYAENGFEDVPDWKMDSVNR